MNNKSTVQPTASIDNSFLYSVTYKLTTNLIYNISLVDGKLQLAPKDTPPKLFNLFDAKVAIQAVRAQYAAPLRGEFTIHKDTQ